MRIEIGDYIIVSDPQCMWIEEKYTGKTKDKKPKEYTRRVSGYCRNFKELLKNFQEYRTRNIQATNMTDFLADMAKIQNDMEMFIDTLVDKKMVRCKK